jgi:hypothetical protein
MSKPRIYRDDFSNWAEVVENFTGNCPKEEPRFVFAEYEPGDYCGSAVVITSNDGEKFSLVEGSHCSCMGLEDQWEPTEHTEPEIRKMMEANFGFFHRNRNDLAKWIEQSRKDGENE